MVDCGYLPLQDQLGLSRLLLRLMHPCVRQPSVQSTNDAFSHWWEVPQECMPRILGRCPPLSYHHAMHQPHCHCCRSVLVGTLHAPSRCCMPEVVEAALLCCSAMLLLNLPHTLNSTMLAQAAPHTVYAQAAPHTQQCYACWLPHTHCCYHSAQAMDIVHPWTLDESGQPLLPITTFSIAMIHRQSGGKLPLFVQGIKALEAGLGAGDRVLIAEACNHNRITDHCNDIGMVQVGRPLALVVCGGVGGWVVR